MVEKISIEEAYLQCESLARRHYENFPVASFFLPKRIRRPIAVIYAFARQADDIADEGNLSSNERLDQLAAYWHSLDIISHSNTLPAALEDPVFIALWDVLQTHSLPVSLLFDLLRAFQQDVVKKTYDSFEDILLYCQWSANPVGRLLLHLTDQATEQNCQSSDAICTALQLINFLQDLHSDLQDRNRCYLPLNEMRKLQIEIQDLFNGEQTPSIQILIQAQLDRANHLFEEGKLLCKRLKGLFGFEIALMVAGGLRITQKLENRKNVYDTVKISKMDFMSLIIDAITLI